MVHREQEFRELCADCGELATNSCQRCAKPLCDDHIPPTDARCDSCEQVWSKSIVKSSERAAVARAKSSAFDPALATFGALAFGAGVLGSMAGNLESIVAAGIGAMIGISATRRWRTAAALQLRRVLFLQERPPKQLTKKSGSAHE